MSNKIYRIDCLNKKLRNLIDKMKRVIIILKSGGGSCPTACGDCCCQIEGLICNYNQEFITVICDKSKAFIPISCIAGIIVNPPKRKFKDKEETDYILEGFVDGDIGQNQDSEVGVKQPNDTVICSNDSDTKQNIIERTDELEKLIMEEMKQDEQKE